MPCKRSMLQSEHSEEYINKQQANNSNYTKLRLDDLIIDKPQEFRIKTSSDIKMSLILENKRRLAQPANIEWMYNYKSSTKLHKQSKMNEYLKSVIEENKLRPTIGQLPDVRIKSMTHTDFIKEKYDFRKKIFQNPRKVRSKFN
ncbi:unnamed protein product (macronuclear) [Paramecium tetraurelia]|uniref:Uncharacterized protein n=1 Tax=Paramecium tetraurelia TaxID=5888 RepID=A0CKN7_PARTE|nr:uncharacterized protein GSPATT00001068001 [Paramecium tetraurelia]CAK71354.1 unnamed protein product [Paramecium tetraurelia]|eukprot:XP_001438751.1 hypothetical protein (macronuclear) [Paramecium tetraurelia strain d4-2]